MNIIPHTPRSYLLKSKTTFRVSGLKLQHKYVIGLKIATAKAKSNGWSVNRTGKEHELLVLRITSNGMLLYEIRTPTKKAYGTSGYPNDMIWRNKHLSRGQNIQEPSSTNHDICSGGQIKNSLQQENQWNSSKNY